MTQQNNSRQNTGGSIPFGQIFSNIFVIVFIAFTFHRLLNHKFLSEALNPESPVAAFFVGSMSDLWVTCLLTFIVSPVLYAASRYSKPFRMIAEFIFFVTLIGTLSAHQGYVEFFKFQIEPFHLSYLTDAQFINSNAASFLTSSNVLLTMLVGTVSFLAFSRKVKPYTPKRSLGIIALLSLTSLVAHNRNIHFRVQWFIPENLQTNVFESLYLRTKKLGFAEKLDPEDYLTAQHYYAHNYLPPGNDRFLSTIFSNSLLKSPDTHPIASAIKQSFEDQVKRGSKPTVVVVLLESLRPAETGFFAPQYASLTPHLDELAKSGIWFKNAFSTGSVTRSGQEATLCGNFSGRNTSLMRNFDALPYQCLTDEISDEVATKFWFHGGDGRFDGQEAFWSKHKVPHLMTMKSFSSETARTGWGVGDFTFFKEAAQKIHSLHQLSSTYSIGMLLSVTNHIPWHLPTDVDVRSNGMEPWFATTSYTDKSIGSLVADMKKNNTWGSTLMFVLSDHGNKTTPYINIYEHTSNINQLLQSHIALIITGGITEAALAEEQLSSLVLDHYVSQTDISATIADIVGLQSFIAMGKNLFDHRSKYPVLSQTEEGIYVPALDKFIPYTELNKKLPSTSAPDWLFRFHFKAALEYLLEMRSKS